MKKAGNLALVLCLALASLTQMPLAFAGANTSGGGFYGFYKGQWVLLDELEAGIEVHPEKESYFLPVQAILEALDHEVPGLSADLRKPLVEKKWHLVPYPLTCEAPVSPINLPISAGACQDENDIWIEADKFNIVVKERLILHELIQGVRLKSNKTREKDPIPAASVRAIHRLLNLTPFPKSSELVEALRKYGFTDYKTQEEIDSEKAYQAEKARIMAEFSARLDAMEARCSRESPMTLPIEQYKAQLDCLESVYEEMDKLYIHPGGPDGGTDFELRIKLDQRQLDLLGKIRLLRSRL